MSNYQQFRTLKSNACSLEGRPQAGMRKPTEKLTFVDWLEKGFQHFEEAGGQAESYVAGEIIFTVMTKPDGSFTVRTDDEFETEYRAKYLRISQEAFFQEGVIA